MKVLAAHDADGNVQYIVVSPEGAPTATVATESTLFVTEVDAADVMPGLDDREHSDRRVAEVMQQLQQFRVELKGRAKLVRKSK